MPIRSHCSSNCRVPLRKHLLLASRLIYPAWPSEQREGISTGEQMLGMFEGVARRERARIRAGTCYTKLECWCPTLLAYCEEYY